MEGTRIKVHDLDIKAKLQWGMYHLLNIKDDIYIHLLKKRIFDYLAAVLKSNKKINKSIGNHLI